MRHLAWLNAVPDGSKKSRFKSYKEANEDSPYLKLPDVDEAEYLVSLLYEAGLLESTGMGVNPLSWRELESWINCTCLQLTTWEVLTLKEMSEAYVSEFTQASDKDRPAPYDYADSLEVKRKEVASKLKSFFSSRKKK